MPSPTLCDGSREATFANDRMSRRSFLGVAAGLASLAAGATACGTQHAKAGSRTTKASKVHRGGTLRIGATGGTSSDTLNADTEVNNTDVVRAPLLYDSLVGLSNECEPVLQLAEEITPNKDATSWTVRVRKGVSFHNGKPLTAEDVLYTFQQMMSNKWNGSVNYTLIDLNSSRVLDAHTVRFAFKSSFSTFVEELAGANGSAILPVGYNSHHPIGTGPFRFKSFQPGVRSVFVRNDNYWQHGLPYVDSVMIQDFQDEASQVNALESDNLDVLAFVEAGSLSGLKSSGMGTLTSAGGAWNPITMLVDRPPFNDVRVREAFKLLVDRRALREAVFAGHGVIGNDLYATWDPEYNTSLPQRPYDVEKAKHLLRKAGAEGISVSLVTSNISAGIVSTATVFAQQASAAGVTVRLNTVSPTSFFGPAYLHRPFSQDVWSYLPYWPTVAQSSLPFSDYNDTHFDNGRYVQLYKEALKAVDSKLRKELAWEMQAVMYDEGGYIVPVVVPNLMAYGSHVRGLTASKSGYPFNNGSDILRVWLD